MYATVAAAEPPAAAPTQKFCHLVLVVRTMRRSLVTTQMKMRVGAVSIPARIMDQNKAFTGFTGVKLATVATTMAPEIMT